MEIFLEVLTADQQEILPKLAFLKKQNFYLAGGTALALQISHRTSVDFDFYTKKDFQPEEIYEQFQKQENRKILLSSITEKNTLLLELNDISISLFTYSYPLVGNLIKTQHFDLASLEDIAAMKMIAIVQRGTKRDFTDFYFLIKKIGLENIFNYAKKKYPGFNEYLALQSLTYFKDAEIESNDRNIKLLKPFNWKNAKKFFIAEVEKIEEKWRRKK
jgi:predicted nucleotidyltransferase component of viral defense system